MITYLMTLVGRLTYKNNQTWWLGWIRCKTSPFSWRNDCRF